MPRQPVPLRSAAAVVALAVGLVPVAPAAAATATPAASATPAATVGLALDVAADGRGPFTPDDGPARDSGPANGVVRTEDSVTYRATVNADGGTAHDERFVLDAPDGTSWDGVPLPCRGPVRRSRADDSPASSATSPVGTPWPSPSCSTSPATCGTATASP